MKQLFPTIFALSIMTTALAEPLIEDAEKINFSIGETSISSSGWCAWFSPLKEIDPSWSLSLPDGWDRSTQLWFCDSVNIVADNSLEFLKAMQIRYEGCLDITVNARPDVKEIIVKMGPNMVLGRRDESATYTVVIPEGEKVVAEDSYQGHVNYMCAHDLANAPDKDNGYYKIMEAALDEK